MNCPMCTSEMLTRDLRGVEIDICPKCKGVWLDEGELNGICGLDPQVGRILDCPKCGGEMQVKVTKGVEIDLCPGCRSIYLDAGELEKLSGVDPESGKPIKLSTFFEREFLKELQKHQVESDSED